MAARMILVGGGARSGKSRFAMSLALEHGPKRLFVATAQPLDAEMERRIERHQAERGEAFRTLEVSGDLGRAIENHADVDVLLVDCLTLYLSNLLLAEPDPEAPEAEARILLHLEQILAAIERHAGSVILVSNEVGMGIVPMSPLGRVFRDLSGRANQLFAAHADEVYFAALGVILRLRPDPLVALPRPTP